MAEFPCAATAAPVPEQINCRLFIEKHREFIDIYRILWKFIFLFHRATLLPGRAVRMPHPSA
ncbi:MAG: hypothetical protein OXL41_13030 [Nitrospinae bacterium]|nr:hypothetical protein [Nitrospinota bacterium]